MGSLSPVIEAFLNGKQLQTDALNKAQDWALKKQQLDEMAKQFQTTSKQAQSRLQLERDIHDLAAKKSELDMHHQILNDIQEGRVLPDQTTQTPAMNLPQQPSAIPGMGGGFNLSTPTSTTVPTAGTPITVGDFSGNMPFTSPEIAAQQQNLLIPGQIAGEQAKSAIATKQYKDTVGDTKNQAMQNAMDMLQNKLESQAEMNKDKLDTQKQINDAHMEVMKQGIDMRETVAAMNERSKNMQMMQMAGLPADPDALKGMASTAASQMALGQADKKDFHPLIGNNAENLMASSGFIKPPKGTLENVQKMANDAVTAQNNIENFSKQLTPPTSIGGKVGNIFADKLGIGGLSPYKSQYDAFMATNLPSLDVAVGLTPGALSRSPKLYDKVKSLLPLPGDSPGVVANKAGNITDMYLSHINGKLTSLPAQQRSLFWKEIVNNNPEILNNKAVGTKLLKAIDNGNYAPGSIYKELIGGQ